MHEVDDMSQDQLLDYEAKHKLFVENEIRHSLCLQCGAHTNELIGIIFACLSNGRVLWWHDYHGKNS